MGTCASRTEDELLGADIRLHQPTAKKARSKPLPDNVIPHVPLYDAIVSTPLSLALKRTLVSSQLGLFPCFLTDESKNQRKENQLHE